MTPQVRIDPDAPPSESLPFGLFHSSLNIPINYPLIYHPMALSPSIASYPSNVADRFTKPLPRHRFDTLIGDTATTTPTTSVATATVDSSATVVASTAAPVSDSVSSLHPNLDPAPLPIVLDTGASLACPRPLEVTQASCGLFRSPISVVSKALASSTPVDPYALITGEDVSVDPIDLSHSDSDATTISDLSSFTKVTLDVRAFGTATLTFIYSKSSSELLHIFVDPIQVDWLHWIPLPRLTPTESYFHIFGRDYLQAFALFHLIPIWIALVCAFLRSD